MLQYIVWSTFSDPLSALTWLYGEQSEEFYQGIRNVLLAHACLYDYIKHRNRNGNYKSHA